MSYPIQRPGPIRGRLAVVQCGGRQGSGYLLSPWLVLTAAHVVAAEEAIRVTVPGPDGEQTARRVWSRHDDRAGVDAALLVLDGIGDAVDRDLPPRWAKVVSLAPIPGCRAIGFPLVQRGEDDRLDTEQVIGTYKPGSGMFSGRDVLAIDGAPPEPRVDGASPWAGLSGAAVFAGDVLLGVITADPRGWGHGRVTVTPVHRLLRDVDFHAVVNEIGYPLPPLVGPPGQLTDEVSECESRYTGYVAHRHGTLQIFGLDLSDKRGAAWPLDAAYYSLEAAPSRLGERLLGHGAALPVGPIPAEQALAGHERVLLRGVAGSGKTTLIQWLAVTTARQELGGHTQHLRNLVPFVLPLRTVARRDRLPAPADFLSAVEVPIGPRRRAGPSACCGTAGAWSSWTVWTRSTSTPGNGSAAGCGTCSPPTPATAGSSPRAPPPSRTPGSPTRASPS